MMEMNKYDLVETLAKNLVDISCHDCPIREECNVIKHCKFILF